MNESENIYSVYMLMDENNHVFYVGFTKNFETRMYEHKLLQGKNKKKDRIIKRMGRLNVKVQHGLPLDTAKDLEKKLIKRFRSQLANKHAGGNYVPHQPSDKAKRTKTNRRCTCPMCGQKFLHISRHKCKGGNDGKR
jgi:predicted GIY-YIG superfamily endonuclease